MYFSTCCFSVFHYGLFLPALSTICSGISLIHQSTHLCRQGPSILSLSIWINTIHSFFQKASLCSHLQRSFFLPKDKWLVHVPWFKLHLSMFICRVIILPNWTALKTNDSPSPPLSSATCHVFFPGLKCLLHPLQTTTRHTTCCTCECLEKYHTIIVALLQTQLFHPNLTHINNKPVTVPQQKEMRILDFISFLYL